MPRRDDETMPGAVAPHIDEGTAHALIDGALDAAETARVDAHLATCAACAALVTEARGFTAGAARILGALDAVPGGVLPRDGDAPRIDAPRATRRRPTLGWPARAAAAVLVLAGGAAVLARGGARPGVRQAAADRAYAPAPARESAPMSEPPRVAVAPSVAPSAAPRAMPRPAAPPMADARTALAAGGGGAAEMRAAAKSRVADTMDSARTAPVTSGLTAAAPAVAEHRSGVVAGVVTARDGQPLHSVVVVADSPRVTATTDAAGRFVLRGVPPGDATLTARRIGFAPQRTTVRVATADTARATMVLESQPVALSEVVTTTAAIGGADLARVACWEVSVGAWEPAAAAGAPEPALPELLRQRLQARRGGLARVQLRDARDGTPITLELRREDGGWTGTARTPRLDDARPARRAAVSLTPASEECTPR